MSDDYGSYNGSTKAPDYEQDIDEILDYQFNWAAKLNGDTIATSTFTFPDGLAEDSRSNTDTTTTVFVDAAGGSCGSVYRVTNHVVTDGGREMDKTIRILIVEN